MNDGRLKYAIVAGTLAIVLLAACPPAGNVMAAQPAPADDLRAAYATPQDIADGKKVAQASCANCHGIDGIAPARDTPNIAGQRAVYMHRELLVYKAGARGNTARTTPSAEA